jgi:hypothetical protein
MAFADYRPGALREIPAVQFAGTLLAATLLAGKARGHRMS